MLQVSVVLKSVAQTKRELMRENVNAMTSSYHMYLLYSICLIHYRLSARCVCTETVTLSMPQNYKKPLHVTGCRVENDSEKLAYCSLYARDRKRIIRPFIENEKRNRKTLT